MRRRIIFAIGGAALVLGSGFVAGCSHAITPQERAASFAAHTAAQIDGQPGRDYLLARIAILVGGAQVRSLEGTDDAPEKIELGVQERTRLGFGSATVIDARGYLLTAAHCVTTEPVYLFFSEHRTTGKFERARVVWRGDPDKRETDVAILRIPHRLDAVLGWASDFKTGDAVLTAGLDYDEASNFEPGCVAGTVTKIDRRARAVPAFEFVYHETPLHGGDSGGPLTTTDGKLIGINTGAGSLRIGPFRWLVARAERPDVAWLRRVIEDDYAKSAAEK